MDESRSELRPGDIRLIALSFLWRVIRRFSLMDNARAMTILYQPPTLLRLRTEEEEAAQLRSFINELREEQPFHSLKLACANTLLQRILDSSDLDAASKSLNEVKSFAKGLGDSDASEPEASLFTSSFQSPGRILVEASSAVCLDQDISAALNRDQNDQRFIASVMQMCRVRRNAGTTEFTDDEYLAIERAYQLIDTGVRLPRNYEWIKHTNDRPVQTYLSFADPGDGHLALTVRDRDFLQGLIVHVEYIDRGNISNKDLVEAYRLPAIKNAARVRLHVGNAAPCTAFIGRPVFEAKDFGMGLLKAAHTVASVCSAMFSHGIADCKIAMDEMTAKETVDFMRVVAGNVVRDPFTQLLSAAFNINSPIKDDLASREHQIENRLELAEMAIRLVRLGHFNKVAWDGAGHEVPSQPIIGQLSKLELLRLIHDAHSKGLETYISAGMSAEHMGDAVILGVGGVGIGTSLHYQSPNTGVGAINPKPLRAVLNEQQKTMGTCYGKIARGLAQLDWRHAEGAISNDLNNLRMKVFAAMEEYVSSTQNNPDQSARFNKPMSAMADDLEARLSAEAQKDIQVETKIMVDLKHPETSSGYLIPVAGKRMSLGSAGATRDPLEQWAYRVLAAYEGDKSGRDTPIVDGELANQIAGLLKVGDWDGLRRLYPL